MSTTEKVLDKLEFNLEGVSLCNLANSLEFWAKQFWLKNIHEEYGDQMAFLLYNMSKEMRKADETSI